jgi:hypothetical protein
MQEPIRVIQVKNADLPLGICLSELHLRDIQKKIRIKRCVLDKTADQWQNRNQGESGGNRPVDRVNHRESKLP